MFDVAAWYLIDSNEACKQEVCRTCTDYCDSEIDHDNRGSTWCCTVLWVRGESKIKGDSIQI
jgi:hypothetical protein